MSPGKGRFAGGTQHQKTSAGAKLDVRKYQLDISAHWAKHLKSMQIQASKDTAEQFEFLKGLLDSKQRESGLQEIKDQKNLIVAYLKMVDMDIPRRIGEIGDAKSFEGQKKLINSLLNDVDKIRSAGEKLKKDSIYRNTLVHGEGLFSDTRKRLKEMAVEVERMDKLVKLDEKKSGGKATPVAKGTKPMLKDSR